MSESHLTMAQQIAKVASEFQQQRTGIAPKSVTVVLSEGTLVITLHGALSAAEQEMSKEIDGATKVQEFHRQLFASSSEELRQEIKRITGVEVRGAVAEVEIGTGAIVHAFTSGTMVQVFLLSEGVDPKTWNGPTKS